MRLLAFALILLSGCDSTSEAPPRDGGADAAVPEVPDAAMVDAGTSEPTCPSAVAPDPLREARASCQFAAGAVGKTTLGLDESARAQLPIRHIVVIMKENRSFDHIFGGLGALQPDAETFPADYVNQDRQGREVRPFHLETTCEARDPDHQWNAMHAQSNGGAMDGFVTSAARSTNSDGHFALGYYQAEDLPFYYFLASTYAIADHYFPSVLSGTFPNRDYLYLATSDVVYTTQYNVWPNPSLASIFERLSAAGISWGVYADDHPLEETLNNPNDNWERLNPWAPVSQLLADFASGELPAVSFVDARINLEDEHPPANLELGEAWTKRIYDAAVASPLWNETVILFTYDEAGGFFDHLAPPADACLARAQDADFHELGIRVPLIAISPWARRHYVSKAVREHTSITRFIEVVFGLGALTARDANSDALLDLFDFACAPPPIPDAPAAGMGGCGGARIEMSKPTYAPGEPLVVSFAGGRGNAKDWIGVYPMGVSPHEGSIVWGYVGGGGHTAGAGVRDGTITLGPGSENDTNWPLPPGKWLAYFLVDDGYTALVSTEFSVR
jgi:phospholipase C